MIGEYTKPGRIYSGSVNRARIAAFTVDNQPLFRQALRQALSPCAEVVGEAGLCAGALPAMLPLLPDILLIDITPEPTLGMEIVKSATHRLPGLSAIIFVYAPDENLLFRAIRSGAAALLSKNTTAQDLVALVKQVSGGDYPIRDTLLAQPEAARRYLDMSFHESAAATKPPAAEETVSPREMEVLRMIARGFSNKQIAFTAGISEQTVKNHMTSILRKLNAHDRTHALVQAMRRGLIATDEVISEAEAAVTA